MKLTRNDITLNNQPINRSEKKYLLALHPNKGRVFRGQLEKYPPPPFYSCHSPGRNEGTIIERENLKKKQPRIVIYIHCIYFAEYSR